MGSLLRMCWSWLTLILLVLLLGACEGDVVTGEVVEGEVVAGEVVPGEVVAGQAVEGGVVQGEVVPGEVVAGQAVEGGVVQGEVVPGGILQGAVVPHTDYSVAVIFLKHPWPYCPSQAECDPVWSLEDQALILPPRHTAGEYQAILNNLVNDYFDKNTYGQVGLSFTSIINPASPDGWFDAPHRIFQYAQATANLHQDGMQTAYAAIGESLRDYDVLLIVHGYQGRSAQAGAIAGPPPDFGSDPLTFNLGSTSITMFTAWASENSTDPYLAAQVSHELGHVMGAPDQYNGYTGVWPAMGPWDLMADDAHFNHFGAWSKWNRGWTGDMAYLPCIHTACSTTAHLDPLEYSGMHGLQVAFVPGTFTGYLAECRKQVNHDENIPEEGVLITEVEPFRASGPVVQVVSPTGDEDFSTAALGAGEVFVDLTRHITIANETEPGDDGCTVRAERGDTAIPDPAVLPNSYPGDEPGMTIYKSRDIWIDSPMNGWDEYPFGESYEQEGGVPSPSGFGDPFWVGHENRIKFRIRNSGYGPAEHVVVNVYVRQPLFFAPSSPICSRSAMFVMAELVGSVVVDELEEGTAFFGSVPWTPNDEGPAQVFLSIEDYNGELTHSNNSGKETYVSYFSAQAQTETTGQQVFSFSVGLSEICLRSPFGFLLSAIEERPRPGWKVEVVPETGVLIPGDEQEVTVTVKPPADAQPGDCGEGSVGFYALSGDVFAIADGFSYRSCVVAPSTLTCQTPAEPVIPGSPAAVTGALSPSRTGEVVTLEYTNPNGERSLRQVETDASGTYRDDLIPDVPGGWTMQAFWQGTDESSAASSAVCRFVVGEDHPATSGTLTKNAFCRRGPGTAYDVVTGMETGYSATLDGRNTESTWYRVHEYRCWIYAVALKLDGDAQGLPVLKAAAAPTLTPETGCWVRPAAGGPTKCVVPCPDGASPGTACTP